MDATVGLPILLPMCMLYRTGFGKCTYTAAYLSFDSTTERCWPPCPSVSPLQDGGGDSLASLSAQAARLMERMVSQNLHNEMVLDFKVGGSVGGLGETGLGDWRHNQTLH